MVEVWRALQLNSIYMKKDTIPGQHVISREPFPASRKVYVPGRLHPIHVAMREIAVGDTIDTFAQMVTPNPTVTVYDTSGPYTDPAVEIDVREGLPRLREEWSCGGGMCSSWSKSVRPMGGGGRKIRR